jgi:hypothetical protein
MGDFTDGFRIRKIKFTFSRADRLSICRALIVRRSAKWNGWDCKQWRMMRTTTEKKLNVSIYFIKKNPDGLYLEC